MFPLLANIGIALAVLTAFVSLLRALLGLEREWEDRRKRRRYPRGR